MANTKLSHVLSPATTLERHVAKWFREQARGSYEGDIAAVAKDLFYGGCQSGTVGHLIYTRDCVRFYKRHAKAIDALLTDMLDSVGSGSPGELFGDKWDATDPLARDDANQNLLAWFGFEETARALCDRAGIEV